MLLQTGQGTFEQDTSKQHTRCLREPQDTHVAGVLTKLHPYILSEIQG